jgi:hypothetical protein
MGHPLSRVRKFTVWHIGSRANVCIGWEVGMGSKTRPHTNEEIAVSFIDRSIGSKAWKRRGRV